MPSTWFCVVAIFKSYLISCCGTNGRMSNLIIFHAHFIYLSKSSFSQGLSLTELFIKDSLLGVKPNAKRTWRPGIKQICSEACFHYEIKKFLFNTRHKQQMQIWKKLFLLKVWAEKYHKSNILFIIPFWLPQQISLRG